MTSTGQTFLALGAIILFMYLSININRSYLTATQNTVDQQIQNEAINYGQSLVEEISATPYDTLNNVYNKYDNEQRQSSRKEFVTLTEDTLYATIEISPEKELIYNTDGKVATVSIFFKKNGIIKKHASYTFALTNLTSE